MTPGYNTQLALRIDWADLDLFGHVNNVAFFKYIQAARLNYCEQVGLTSLNERGKLSFMVASSHCNFKKPLLYPGNIAIFTRVEWIKNTSLQLAYRLLNDAGELCAEAEDVLVIFDYEQNTKVTIPQSLKDNIEKIETKQQAS